MTEPTKEGSLPRIENWSLGFSVAEGNRYTPPERQAQSLEGYVYNHPTHKDGQYIRTSRIIQLNIEEGWVKTVYSTYLLGKPSAEYQKFLNERAAIR